ncbi:hypothetical protein C1H46_027315 [Malus baccata]|uniref:Uncharacterized protein n=1 Tax=Malus baccata TaxID=106549 RepID=A0A540LL18_MALBA|nr:hypothetical protein C1H46_027315 [Malus baccata]
MTPTIKQRRFTRRRMKTRERRWASPSRDLATIQDFKQIGSARSYDSCAFGKPPRQGVLHFNATKIRRKVKDCGRLEKKEKGIGEERDGLPRKPPKREGPRPKMRLDWGVLTRERRFMGCLNTSMNDINK